MKDIKLTENEKSSYLLAELIKLKGYNANTFALKSGIAKSYLYRLLNGESSVYDCGIETLFKISNTLGYGKNYKKMFDFINLTPDKVL